MDQQGIALALVLVSIYRWILTFVAQGPHTRVCSVRRRRKTPSLRIVSPCDIEGPPNWCSYYFLVSANRSSEYLFTKWVSALPFLSHDLSTAGTLKARKRHSLARWRQQQQHRQGHGACTCARSVGVGAMMRPSACHVSDLGLGARLRSIMGSGDCLVARARGSWLVVSYRVISSICDI
jgi:hypothetical protein